MTETTTYTDRVAAAAEQYGWKLNYEFFGETGVQVFYHFGKELRVIYREDGTVDVVDLLIGYKRFDREREQYRRAWHQHNADQALDRAIQRLAEQDR